MIDIFLHNVAWLRKYHGLTKKEMAKKLGISVWMLNKIERGELPSGLKIDVLYQIRKVFGIPMADSLSVWLNAEELYKMKKVRKPRETE